MNQNERKKGKKKEKKKEKRKKSNLYKNTLGCLVGVCCQLIKSKLFVVLYVSSYMLKNTFKNVYL
jgi:hypothetical protein